MPPRLGGGPGGGYSFVSPGWANHQQAGEAPRLLPQSARPFEESAGRGDAEEEDEDEDDDDDDDDDDWDNDGADEEGWYEDGSSEEGEEGEVEEASFVAPGAATGGGGGGGLLVWQGERLSVDELRASDVRLSLVDRYTSVHKAVVDERLVGLDAVGAATAVASGVFLGVQGVLWGLCLSGGGSGDDDSSGLGSEGFMAGVANALAVFMVAQLPATALLLAPLYACAAARSGGGEDNGNGADGEDYDEEEKESHDDDDDDDDDDDRERHGGRDDRDDDDDDDDDDKRCSGGGGGGGDEVLVEAGHGHGGASGGGGGGGGGGWGGWGGGSDVALALPYAFGGAACFCAAVTGQVVAVVLLPEAVAMPLTQLNLIVASLWGIAYYGEIQSSRLVALFAAAVAIALAGAALLSGAAASLL